MPTSDGFDPYFGLLYSNDMTPPWVQTECRLELYSDLEPVESRVDQDILTVRNTEEALRFIGTVPSSIGRSPAVNHAEKKHEMLSVVE